MLESESGADSRTPARLFALKQGDTFVVADACGNITGEGDGLFHDDTRLLSQFRLTVAGRPLELLGGAVGEDNVVFTANLTNRPLPPIGGQSTRQGVIHVERSRLIWEDRLYERLRLRNYGLSEAHLPLRLEFAADFRDMFEVRGLNRATRGRTRAAVVAEDSIELSYEGLDGLLRVSTIVFGQHPTHLAPGFADFELSLAPGLRTDIFYEVGLGAAETPSRQRFRTAAAKARLAARSARRRGARVETSGRVFSEWLNRSRADLALLTTDLDTGPYPYAGIPWFSTAFGRDAIITALQMLWLDPSLARGVLRYLARHQATETSRFTDAAPGKIMHETRKGEMVRLGELPFGRYYGGVDTTPLFVTLAGAYAARTGDLGSGRGAMAIAAGGDGLGRGRRRFQRRWLRRLRARGRDRPRQSGLEGQRGLGLRRGGRRYRGPGGARRGAGLRLRRLPGDGRAGAVGAAKPSEVCARWQAKAERLRLAVEERFWVEELGTYALALDGHGQPCRVRASNAGHLLFVGLPTPERGRRVAEGLLDSSLNSGWGLRTLGALQPRYNPMSYHNGSVWPHDTAICTAGIARYGLRDGAAALLSAMFETAVRLDMRLPELFCGFPRRPGEPPIAYPVACLPQAWAAGLGVHDAAGLPGAHRRRLGGCAANRTAPSAGRNRPADDPWAGPG